MKRTFLMLNGKAIQYLVRKGIYSIIKTKSHF